MPFPLNVLPDDETALIEYLGGISRVTDLVPASRISTQLPSKPMYPVVLIQRAGGVSIFPAMDEAALQVDVVGGTKQVCKVLTQTVRAAILAIENDIVSGVVLASATEEVGPSWLPDTIPVPPISRYTARYRILLHN